MIKPEKPLPEIIAETFPNEDSATVLEILNLYGTETYERDQEWVQRAILKLCHRSNVDELLNLVAAAKTDYRDVLYWLELESQRNDKA